MILANSQFVQIILIYSLPFLYLSSIISLSKGALFDAVFLPISLMLIFFSYFQKKIITYSIKQFSYLYFFSIFFVFIIKNIFFFKEDQFFIYLILSYRILLPILLLIFISYLYKLYLRLDKNKKLKVLNSSIFIWNLSMIITSIFSIKKFTGSLGFSFPLYAAGNIDRQVFGPAMAFVSLTAFVILLELNFQKNKTLLFFSYFTFLLATICSIGSASRGSILIFTVFLLVSFPKKIFYSIKKKLFFLITFNLGLFTFFIYFIYKNFPVAFEIQIMRALSFFNAISSPLSDVSRKDVIQDFLTILQDPINWPLGIDKILLTPDSGPGLFLINYGLIPLLFFIIIFYLLFLSNKNRFIRGFVAAALCQFLFSSETIFIPRYIFLVNWSFILMFLIITFKKNVLHEDKNTSFFKS